MSIRSKHQELAAKYHWLITPLATIVLGYLGVGEYKKYEAAQAAIAPVTITFEADALGGGDEHPFPHPPAAHSHRSKDTIQAMIDKAVNAHQTSKQYHEYDQ